MLAAHNSISVGQAVFASSPGGRGRGYHLVARSSGIGDSLARHLARWGPAHGSLLTDAPEGSSLNYLSIDNEWAAVSRTVYGGPEYSCRGALQVVTFILAMRHEQLASYDNNPVLLARTAMLLGYLRLSSNMSERLPDVHLPVDPPVAVVNEQTAEAGRDAGLVRSIQLLNRGERIALVGGQSPIMTLQRLFECTPPPERWQLSFTTGLKPTQNRQFRMHLLPSIDQNIRSQLQALGIRFLAVSV